MSLNIASTRLILLSASQPFGAGLVILTFGTLVTNQNLVVGFILFLILLTIQHMVVTSGAERIAEVRARFALEAVPNKQLSIDADLNAGFITTNEAHDKRRATVSNKNSMELWMEPPSLLEAMLWWMLSVWL